VTPLRKKVIRETSESWDHHGRRMIIEIEPPDLISVREKGTRRKFTCKAAWLMQKIIEYGREGVPRHRYVARRDHA
jgi:hypothetical protein